MLVIDGSGKNLLQKYLRMNLAGSHWWLVSIISDNGLVPWDNSWNISDDATSSLVAFQFLLQSRVPN